MNFTGLESEILHRLQKGLPADPEPWKFIGSELGVDEDLIISTVSDLKERGIIRNISGIFSGEALGYYLSLVAFSVSEDNIEKAAEVINSHPGVSHNYLRRHKYNIWFTLAEEDIESFNKSLTVMARKACADDTLVLRNEKLLKIGLMLDVGSEKEYTNDISVTMGHGSPGKPLSPSHKEAVVLLQKDLPARRSPYWKLVSESGSGISVESLMQSYDEFLKSGVMRRYAAVLRHRKAGYTSNAMTVWKAEDNFNPHDFVQSSAVSHLYLRTTYPGRWEYPLFAMIHAKSDSELESIITELSGKSGISDYLVLDTLREFKKKRVTYYSDKFTDWKRINYD